MRQELWVLVVAADPLARGDLASLLSAIGWQVLEAADDEEALALPAGPADLIITDLDGPGTDGRAFATAARVIHRDLPIIYLTGRADLCRSVQHSVVLTKPYDPNELLSAAVELVAITGRASKVDLADWGSRCT